MQQIFKDSQGIPFCAFASVYFIPAASQFFSSDFGTFKDLHFTACKDSKKIKEHFSYPNSQQRTLAGYLWTDSGRSAGEDGFAFVLGAWTRHPWWDLCVLASHCCHYELRKPEDFSEHVRRYLHWLTVHFALKQETNIEQKLTISFGGIPDGRNILFLQIFLKRARKPSAGNPVEPVGTWPGPAPKIPKTFCRTFSATFSGTRWTCIKASQTFSWPSPEPCWTWSRNLLWNLVEPDLALHQSLPDLLWILLRNPVEPDLALHQSLPEPSPEPSSEPCGTWRGLAPKPPRPPELCWTWPGSAPKPPNLLRNPVEPDLALHQGFLEPSPEPSLESSPERCWTWPGSAPKHPRPSPEPSEPLEPCWTWLGACTSAHWSYSGLKTPLAYAVGNKNDIHFCIHLTFGSVGLPKDPASGKLPEDGIQRPLERIQQLAQSVFVPRGVDVPNLDRDKLLGLQMIWSDLQDLSCCEEEPNVKCGSTDTLMISMASSWRMPATTLPTVLLFQWFQHVR